eukprot:TRINITY_DN3202_c1_g4_i2.p1 TRINITY_DN3202_c1_g4~~TRINITY_DN3202_c1_g4_i2.p1  ORF type:complete len:67 (-),score=2.00 TRINITY_DN3202_c1_g4_i2:91-291(-)
MERTQTSILHNNAEKMALIQHHNPLITRIGCIAHSLVNTERNCSSIISKTKTARNEYLSTSFIDMK